MDEWESVRAKIQALEVNFLGPSEPPQVKYERSAWEKNAAEERYRPAEDDGLRLLTGKIMDLERKLDSGREVWEERSKANFLEAEIGRIRREMEELRKQNSVLRMDLAERRAPIEEEQAARKQAEAEKARAEESLKKLEEKMESSRREVTEKIRQFESDIFQAQTLLAQQEKALKDSQERNARLERDILDLSKDNDLLIGAHKAREIERLKDREELVAGFIHRLKSHIGILTGMVKDLSLPEPPASFDQSAGEMRALTEDFLALTRFPDLRLEKNDLNVLAARAVSNLAPAIQAKRLEVYKDFDAHVPSIPLDAELVLSALEKLLENALQESPEGARVEIKTEFRAMDKKVVVTISDKGPGIPPDLEKKVFRPFFTLHKNRRGLGLSIAKRNIELHHGNLALKSRPDQGAAAVFEIPLP